MDDKVFYARVSTNKVEQEESLESQQSYFKGLSIEKGYIDQGDTGTYIDRPEFLRMLHDAGLDIKAIKNGTKEKLVIVSSNRKPKFKYIYTKSVNRFSRDTSGALDIIRELKSKNVFVYFQDIATSTEGVGGDLLVSIMLTMGQQESQSISERVKFGNRQTAEKGTIRSCLAYGYKYSKEDKSLTIVPTEKPVVELMFNLRAEGKGGRLIANELNRLGYKNRKGTEWKPHIIMRMLKNPVYTGRVARNRYDCDYMFGNNTRRLRPKEEWIVQTSDKIEPIISIEIFDKANKLIEEATHENQKGGKYAGVTDLSGKIKCKCGANYTRNIDRKERGYGEYIRVFYNCSNKKRFGVDVCNARNISSEEIENIITFYTQDGQYKKVCDSFMNDINKKSKENIERLKNSICDDNKNEIENNKKRIGELKEKFTRVMEYYVEGGLSKDTLEVKKSTIENEITYLELSNKNLGATTEEINNTINKLMRLNNIIKNMSATIPEKITREDFIDKYLYNFYLDNNKVGVNTQVHLLYVAFQNEVKIINGEEVKSEVTFSKMVNENIIL